MYHQKVSSNNICERRSKQLFLAFHRKKCRLTLALFFAHFAMVCMGENRAGDFLTHAFITVYNGDFERVKISLRLQNYLEAPKYTWFELIQETFCKANCSTLFLELFFFKAFNRIVSMATWTEQIVHWLQYISIKYLFSVVRPAFPALPCLWMLIHYAFLQISLN